MHTETHLIRVDITRAENGLYGCVLKNGHGETLVIITARHADKIKAVKKALQNLTQNDFLPMLEAV